MSKYARPVLIGLVVGFVVACGVGFLYGALGIQGSHLPLVLGFFIGCFTAYILANLSGNRARPAATAADKAEALAAEPPPGKALLYVYREGFVAKLVGLNIMVDGQVVAQLKSPAFTRIAIAPGSHIVSAAFGGLAGPQNKPSEVTVEASAGASVALRMTMKLGSLKNTVDITPQTDLDAVKRALAGMTMTQPDVAEL